jgi:hypothetical protein
MALANEFNPLYTLNGCSPARLRATEEAGGPQTYTPGNCVVINDAKFLQESASAADAVTGVACNSALGAEGEVIFWVLDQNTVFEAPPTTPGNVTDNTYLYTFCDLTVAAGLHSIDENASTDDLFYIVGIDLTANVVRMHAVGGGDCDWNLIGSAVNTAFTLSVAAV